MRAIKVYIAGKVSANSIFKTSFWRDEFCKELEKKAGVKFTNLDPTSRKEMPFDPVMVFGRDAFLIKSSDLVIVNLTDDISVGGSQEMLIAKYFNKPLLGIARKGGKFADPDHNDFGRIIDFIHPFVKVPCDAIVHDIEGAAEWIKNSLKKIKKPKGIDCIDDSLRYYLKNFFAKDEFAKKVSKN
ncbi:MAG: hypothetical protein HYW25_04760 [Candidatus Aenigmarchaeota archaeon]|nr:hypothetical protein [Candidatus Aenigmarchaeota archaeon]